MDKKRIVLVGLQAQGKTTFFNKITNQNQPTQYAGQSCTRKIVVGISNGIEEFEVIDTPGFNSSQEKLLHVAGILAALTYGPLNRILIIVKYGRNDAIKEKFDKIFRLIQRYNNIVTVIITHWDELEADVDERTEKERLAGLFEKTYRVSSILYFSKKNPPQNISIQIEKILFTNQKQTVNLTDGEIYKFFDLLELGVEEKDVVENLSSQILVEFRRIAKVYKKFIEAQKNTDPNYLSILHELIQMIKSEAINKVEEFEKKHGEEIVNLADVHGHKIQYLQYIRLKKELQLDVEYVINLAQSQMAKSQYHFFNFLKKCPYCHQVWLKVTGCDNLTVCGNRVNSAHDGLLLLQTNKKIAITRQDQQFLVQVNEHSISLRDDFIEQIMRYIQKNFNYQENDLYDRIKLILEQLHGQNYKENIIEKFLIGKLNEIQLIDTIRIRLNYNEQLYSNSSNILPPPIFSLPQQPLQQQMISQNTNPNQFLRFLNQSNRLLPYSEYEKGVGCGREIIWKDIPPLELEEIQGLFSSELLDYFSDQDRVLQDEVKWLDMTYKELVKDTIKEQKDSMIFLEQKKEI